MFLWLLILVFSLKATSFQNGLLGISYNVLLV